jgi:hypothetical protein
MVTTVNPSIKTTAGVPAVNLHPRDAKEITTPAMQ